MVRNLVLMRIWPISAVKEGQTPERRQRDTTEIPGTP